MLPWMNIVRAGAGAYIAAKQKNIPKWDDAAYGTGELWSSDRGKASSGIALDHLDKVGAGKEIGISAQEMARMTAGQRARMISAHGAQVEGATERAISTGNAGRGGMLEANIATLDKNLLEGQRSAESDALNFSLSQRAADRDRSVQANDITLSKLLGLRGQNIELGKTKYGIDMKRSQFGSTFDRALGGAYAGWTGSAIPGQGTG